MNRKRPKSVLQLEHELTVKGGLRDKPAVFLVIPGAAVVEEGLGFIVAVAAPHFTAHAIIVALSLRYVVPFVRVFAAGFQRSLWSAHLMRSAAELRS